MSPPSKQKIDYEQELAIVRRFLQRNNIDDLMQALQPWGCRVHMVRVVGYDEVLNGLTSAKSVHFSAELDPDGFLDPAASDRLRVPAGAGGHYFIHAEVRWLHSNPQEDFTIAERDAGRFYSQLRVNDSQGPVESSRATNSAVPFASGTTQLCLAEIALNAGDFLKLLVNQTVHDQIQVNAWLTMRRVAPMS